LESRAAPGGYTSSLSKNPFSSLFLFTASKPTHIQEASSQHHESRVVCPPENAAATLNATLWGRLIKNDMLTVLLYSVTFLPS
jgi:hypothetical protein